MNAYFREDYMSTLSINMTHAFGVIAAYAKKKFITPILSSPLPPSFFYAPFENYEMLYSKLLLLSSTFEL